MEPGIISPNEIALFEFPSLRSLASQRSYLHFHSEMRCASVRAAKWFYHWWEALHNIRQKLKTGARSHFRGGIKTAATRSSNKIVSNCTSSLLQNIQSDGNDRTRVRTAQQSRSFPWMIWIPVRIPLMGNREWAMMFCNGIASPRFSLSRD